jgi:hypothetical protein
MYIVESILDGKEYDIQTVFGTEVKACTVGQSLV